MKTTTLVPFLLAFATAMPALAQDKASTAATPAAASAPQGCARAPFKRHDHGAERQMPAPASRAAAPCTAAESDAPAARPDSADKKKPVHDHSRFHKTL
jgi:hypothetical protein